MDHITHSMYTVVNACLWWTGVGGGCTYRPLTCVELYGIPIKSNMRGSLSSLQGYLGPGLCLCDIGSSCCIYIRVNKLLAGPLGATPQMCCTYQKQYQWWSHISHRPCSCICLTHTHTHTRTLHIVIVICWIYGLFELTSVAFSTRTQRHQHKPKRIYVQR